MKIAVLYQSNTGNTKQYAEMISSELKCDLFDIMDTKKKSLKSYDTIIYGGPVIIYRVKKLNKAKRFSKGKKLIIFACGGNPGIEEEIFKIKEKTVPNNDYPFFYLPGGLDFSKLKGMYKFMMGMMKKMLEKNPNKTEDEKVFLKGFYEPVIYVSKENIKDIVNYVNHDHTK